MSNNILFVFEGERTEKNIVSHLQKHFVHEATSFTCVFGAEIYQLYEDIASDPDLDTFVLLKNRNKKNLEILTNFKRSDFAEIYLFFDYDGHASIANDLHLKELLEFFSEETEKGKLYISYPMVEALKHIEDKDNFQNLTVPCKENITYKKLVDSNSLNEFKQFEKYTIETWGLVIKLHVMKMNFIVEGIFEFPERYFSQVTIFSQQLTKYISKHTTVAVLSAFPIFLYDYFGSEGLKRRLNS